MTRTLKSTITTLQPLYSTVSVTETLYEYQTITHTIEQQITSIVEEEEVGVTVTMTDSLGFEAIDEFITEESVQLDTLYSGSTLQDITESLTVWSYSTVTTLITFWTGSVYISTTHRTVTVGELSTRTRFHFHDVTHTRTLYITTTSEDV